MRKLRLAICLMTAGILGLSSSACGQSKQKADTEKPSQKEVIVLIKTTMGDMKVKLYNQTPKHRDNFVKLVKEHYYDGLLFHRVIEGFMIQGGDPESKNAPAGKMLGNGGPNYTVDAEIVPELRHIKGALAAARTGDLVNPQKASSGSQFYIVQGQPGSDRLDMVAQQKGFTYTPEQREMYKTVGGTPFLDGDYTVFGQVIEGLDVIDKIAATPTDPNNRPKEDVKIITMEIIQE